MTTRLSNTAFLTVLDPLPLENIGWTVRVLSERDYATQIALVDRFDGLGFTIEVNGTGGGKVVLDADDRVFTDPMPVGESTGLVGQEALWQFFEDGVFRAEMLAEDVDEDVIPEGGGLRTTTFIGRGTGLVLDWAKVLPGGMPTPTSMTRKFAGHPMTIWHTLFAEAQGAGFLPFVSLLFDAANDSSARPWGASQAVEVQAGDSLLDLLTRWCEACDLTWKMLPGFRLQVLPVAFGRRLESKVVFTLFRGQEKHGRMRTRRDLATVVYAQSGDKGVAVSSDGVATTKWGKRMSWVQAGDTADATGRSAVANTTLALVKDEAVTRSIVVPPDEPTRRVFVDYLLTDWVTVETPENDTESGARQVRAITIDVDKDAKVGLELTLQSRFQSRLEKMNRRLDALGASSGAKSGGSPIPVSQAISATKVEDLSNVDVAGVVAGNVLQWDGFKWVDGSVGSAQPINWLTDVDTVTVAPTDGQTLAYDAASGLWHPVTPAGGVGGSSAMTLDLNLPLTTLTGWSVASGTWVAEAGDIRQTNGSGGAYRLVYATPKPLVECLVEVEIMAGASGGGSENHAGLIIGSPGGNGNNGLVVQFYAPNYGSSTWTAISTEKDGLVLLINKAIIVPPTKSAWHKLRVHVVGDAVQVWVDGVFQFASRNGSDPALAATSLALVVYQADASFRNLKLWLPTLPA